MQNLMFDISRPLKCISCGKLVSNGPWIHPHRVLNSYVLLLGLEGCAHIQQGHEQFCLSANTALLLLPGIEHFGYMPDNNLSYYWCHFSNETGYELLDDQDISAAASDENLDKQTPCIILPIFIPEIQRDSIKVIFRQLLNTSSRKDSCDYLSDYLLTTLLLEIFDQIKKSKQELLQNSKEFRLFNEVLEWIRINIHCNITLESISSHFFYNTRYFSSLFRKHTNQTFVGYLTTLRIAKACDLLFNTKMSIKEVASAVGFSDEKYFMKTFKKYEGLTPTMYRNTVCYTHLNNK